MTDKERLNRIKRLVSLRERARDQAQSALAEARRKADSDRAAVATAEEDWRQECDKEASSEGPASVRDFAEHRNHLNALRRRVEQADVKRKQSEQEEASKLSAATVAHKDLRKMEIWNENETKRIQQETNRREQLITDEIAAQRTNRS